MGLWISLGVLADDEPDPETTEYLRGCIRQVNRVLAAHDLPPHHEPDWLQFAPTSLSLLSISRSSIMNDFAGPWPNVAGGINCIRMSPENWRTAL